MLTRKSLVLAFAGCSAMVVAMSAGVMNANAVEKECTIAVAGDVADEGNSAITAQTAAVIKDIDPQYVLGLGDMVYFDGTPSEFTNYYKPAWGQFDDIMRPTPGNHEYHYQNGSGYYGYFGVEENYSFQTCGWNIISANSEDDISKSAQFIKDAGAEFPDLPAIVYWHAPRFSSGDHGNSDKVKPLWEAANAIGAKLAFGGHDHSYERFAPMDAQGNVNEDGLRSFVVGTGGRALYSKKSEAQNSEIFVKEFGVLQLELSSSGYAWDFLQTNGSSGDSGTMQFEGAPAGPTPVAETPEAPVVPVVEEPEVPAIGTPGTPSAEEPETEEPEVDEPEVGIPEAPIVVDDRPAVPVKPSSPLTGAPVDVVPIVVGPSLVLTEKEGVIVATVAGMPGKSRMTFTATVEGGRGTASVITSGNGRAAIGFLPPPGFDSGKITVRATSGDQTVAKSITLR